MDLIFDTHALIWLSTDHPRLSRVLVARLGDPATRTFVSAVTAWEYEDLRARGRITDAPDLESIREDFRFALLDFPAMLWVAAAELPNLHGDPIDRMLIAHARSLDMTLVTADRVVRQYPVKTLW